MFSIVEKLGSGNILRATSAAHRHQRGRFDLSRLSPTDASFLVDSVASLTRSTRSGEKSFESVEKRVKMPICALVLNNDADEYSLHMNS